MNSCDDRTFLERVIQEAVALGFYHVNMGHRRVTDTELIGAIQHSLGLFRQRRFHTETIKRAYGMAFTNKQKMDWVKARGL